ncbi:hypothetical protein CSC12_1029 [Klebsiella michiganensis]|nr:hypothetical protein CSC12_1029 [Klebsiella michiganensis]
MVADSLPSTLFFPGLSKSPGNSQNGKIKRRTSSQRPRLDIVLFLH